MGSGLGGEFKMKSVYLAGSAAVLAMVAASIPVVEARQDQTTEWVVTAAAGMDALLMIGAASGDVLQADMFEETITLMRGRMSAESVAAMDRLDQALRVEGERLTGPFLAFLFSAGNVITLDDVLASAMDPDTHLKPGLQASGNWDDDRYAEALELMPDVILALEGLRGIGFEDWYASTIMPNVQAGVERNLAAVSSYDIIPEQARLLGRELDPRIEILIVRFNQPYGIRIIGQRFISYYGWDAQIQLRVAAHEIFHPPFDLQDETLREKAASWETDPWFRSIVENHNPGFGYNSLAGVINEDSTQALDQIVSERLGIARDPAIRWNTADDGMHMLAAALYHAMKEDAFDQTGGTYSDWFASALDRGMLTPDEVRRRATEIVGREQVQYWYDVMEDRNTAIPTHAGTPSAHPE
jgi:hypothetical protein